MVIRYCPPLRQSTEFLQIWLLKLTSVLSKLKNKLRTTEVENWQKFNNSQPQLKIYWYL